jgi:GT2 family glycosyltransferase
VNRSAEPAAPTISAVLIAHRSTPELAEAIRSVLAQDHPVHELVLLGNGASVELPALARAAGVAVITGTSSVNLGVAGGRNAAARLASGDLLLFVDDDAVLRPGSLRRAVGAIESPGVAAVAFNVVDPASGRPALWYHPYDPSTWSGRAFEAYTVIGCGHLVRRNCFEELGGLWDGYFRELEELDMSWRLLDGGWTIRYEPGAVVEHPERTATHFRYSVGSNLLMVWRLMPAGAAVRQTAFLVSLFAARAVHNRELGDFLRGVADAVRGGRRLARERSPLGRPTIEYLRRVYACQGPGKRLRWSLRPLSPPPPFGGQPAAR